MNKIKILLIIACMSYILIKTEEKSKNFLTTSVIIPCHPKHVQYLYELLRTYEKQTNLPDEIVISISEISQVETSLIVSLKNTSWLFPVKLILSEQKLFAGQNRNIACNQTTGEIIICQDADDIPHIQRIEIIKYFFEKLNPDFLLHKYVYDGIDIIKQIKTIDNLQAIEYAYIKNLSEPSNVGYMLFGQPAFHKRVFQQIKWRDIPIDEDCTFDREVLASYQNCIMIHCPLYLYRAGLSATPYELYKN